MDWNSDGQPDLVSGDRNGYFNVFIRQETTLTGYYQYRLMDSTILDVGNNSQPAVVDWNGDGKKDLIMGTETGYILFYPNQTDDSWPMFQDYYYIEAQGNPINLYRVNPYVFDLDRDSVQDLLCGANDGYIRFYRNIGTNANPQLAPPETLTTIDGQPIQPPQPYPIGSRCGFGYWNSDTIPDFLLSGYDGTVNLYLGEPQVGTHEPCFISNPSLPQIAIAPVPSRPPIQISLNNLPHPVSSLTIIDATGKTIRTLPLTKKENSLLWDGLTDHAKNAPPGVYFCRAQTAGFRIVLTR
ncbi:MAG: FG-GAP-like repeat-containing protein [bacterium]